MIEKTLHETARRDENKCSDSKFLISDSGFRLISYSRFYVSAMQCLLIVCALASINFAQNDETEAPPPLKIISKAEKSQLTLETKVKDRTKLSLDLMNARLLKAETLSKSEDYQAMFTELGGFHALMDDALRFLSEGDTDSGKILNNFKRMEMSLRKFLFRIELIRRDLPIKYEKYVRSLAKNVRDARSRAIEPLFDDSVLPDKEDNSIL